MERKMNLTVEALDDPPDLTAADLCVLDTQLSEEEAKLAKRRAVWLGLTLAKYGTAAAKERGQPFGVAHVEDGGYDIAIDVPKRVEWSQDGLHKAMAEVEAWGEPIDQYVSVTFAVSEAAYKAWPDTIKKVFEPARTTKPGRPKITIKRMGEMAA